MTTIHSFECQTCGARLDIGRHQRSATCAYCASPSVIERPAAPDRPTPSFAIGFTVPRERALDHARRWVKRALFAPRAFRRSAIQVISGVYIPAYLYTAAAYSWYSAEIGEAYTEKEKVKTTDRDGNRVTASREVTRYEWRALSGEHAVNINDHVVTASRGLPDAELQAITPFDLRSLQRYSPMLMSGWAAEDPSIGRQQSMEMARARARRRVRKQIGEFIPGDRNRLLICNTDFHDEHMELAMLPVWVLPVRYDEQRPPVRLLVNGQTGRVWGRAPISLVKVAVLLTAVVTAVVVAYLGFMQH